MWSCITHDWIRTLNHISVNNVTVLFINHIRRNGTNPSSTEIMVHVLARFVLRKGNRVRRTFLPPRWCTVLVDKGKTQWSWQVSRGDPSILIAAKHHTAVAANEEVGGVLLNFFNGGGGARIEQQHVFKLARYEDLVAGIRRKGHLTTLLTLEVCLRGLAFGKRCTKLAWTQRVVKS